MPTNKKNGIIQMDKVFISINDVARITGISKSKLYKLTALGLIPHYKPTGKLLFKQPEVFEWVEQNRNNSPTSSHLFKNNLKP